VWYRRADADVPWLPSPVAEAHWRLASGGARLGFFALQRRVSGQEEKGKNDWS